MLNLLMLLQVEHRLLSIQSDRPCSQDKFSQKIQRLDMNSFPSSQCRPLAEEAACDSLLRAFSSTVVGTA
jgi:hypothetical protein